MPEIDNPYGVDAEMSLAKDLFRLIAEGYDGHQMRERYNVTLADAEEVIGLYVHRVLHANAPAAPSPNCLISEYDGWCMRHGCYHPAVN